MKAESLTVAQFAAAKMKNQSIFILHLSSFIFHL